MNLIIFETKLDQITKRGMIVVGIMSLTNSAAGLYSSSEQFPVGYTFSDNRARLSSQDPRHSNSGDTPIRTKSRKAGVKKEELTIFFFHVRRNYTNRRGFYFRHHGLNYRLEKFLSFRIL